MTGIAGTSSTFVRRRRLGRYDTPEHVALPLVRWGLRGRPGKILDPSFGGCNFLRASLRVLKETGAARPGDLVYGFDVAEEARRSGKQLVECGVPEDQLVITDFFAAKPEKIPPVDLIVGNPPYIRHHWFQAESRERAVAALARQDVRLLGRANAWAYFLVHAGAFLRHGGRMALLLPGSVCFADYAAEALTYIRQQAGRCRLARIQKRLFADAREDTVILLVDDWGSGPSRLEVDDFETIEDLESFLRRRRRLDETRKDHRFSRHGFELGEEAAKAWEQAHEAPETHALGELARIRIGVVTGANRFFVQPAEKARHLERAGAHSAPILTRGRFLEGLVWSERCQARVEEQGFPSRLIFTDLDRSPCGELREWVRQGEKEQLHERHYCRQRKPWYTLRDHIVPDAFLRYMGQDPPRIVLNPARALVTNAIHRLWWLEEEIGAEAVAVASCTSLFALACELYGRKYGGGVLKIEPGAARRLPIPLVQEAAREFSAMDATLHRRQPEDARKMADELILVRGLGLRRKAVEALDQAATKLAMRRRRQGRFS